MMRRWTIASLLVLTSVGVLAQVQSAKPLDYDTWCKIADGAARKNAWFATTAESRGALVKTHLERWRDANLTRLDDKQKAVLAELIQATTADTYADGPQGEASRTKSRQIATRVESLFTHDDLMAMQPDAPCIAKKSN